MLSGILATSVTFIGSFSTTLWHLYVFAFCSGLSYGLAFPPASIAVSQQFDKKRLGLANGVVTSGIGFGILVMSPVVEILCEEYGWKGALLIHSAITANRIVCSLLMKASHDTRRAYVANREHCKAAVEDATNHPSAIRLTGRLDTRIQEENYVLDDMAMNGRVPSQQRKETYNCKVDESNDGAVKAALLAEANVEGTGESDQPTRQKVIKGGELVGESMCVNNDGGTEMRCFDDDLPVKDNMRDATGSTEERRKPTRLRAFFRALNESLDFTYLFGKPAFVIMLLCVVGEAASAVPGRYYLPSKLVYDLGIPRLQASLAFTVTGACTTFSRAFHGLLLDFHAITLQNLLVISMVLTGICLFVNPFVETFAGQMALAAVFSLGNGMFMPLTMLMTREIVGSAKVSNAFSFAYAIGGVGMFAGIQAMGRLYDATGSYDTPYFVAGSVQAIATVLLIYLAKCIK